MFTKALSWVSSTQFSASQPVSPRSILILCSSGLFPHMLCVPFVSSIDLITKNNKK
jgi:hypothetical protein